MTSTNGHAPRSFADVFRGGSPPGERALALAVNALAGRLDWLRGLAQPDPRRDLDDECGWPKDPTDADYGELYERDAVARRVVEVMPRECWQVRPRVYERESARVTTAFERALADLDRGLGGAGHYRGEESSALLDCARRADELSGIGRYGVVFLGLDDGLPLDRPPPGFAEEGSVPSDEAAPSAPPAYGLSVNAAPRRLLFARALPSRLAAIGALEANWRSPRYGQPARYEVTLADPRGGPSGSASRRVHWSRVLHVCEQDVFHAPRLQPVLNRVYDLRKLYGASAESYWKNCVNKLILETPPEFGGEVNVKWDEVRDAMERFGSGLQNWLGLPGLQAKSLPPAVADPGPHVLAQIQAICVCLGVPMRVFMGTERGELASSQDDADWNDKVRQRQNGTVTSRLLVPLYNRLIDLGVLPVPPGGFRVWWPDLDSQTAQERAQAALTLTQAAVAYAGAGALPDYLTPADFWTRLAGFSDEEALAVEDAARQAREARAAQAPAAQPTPQPPGA